MQQKNSGSIAPTTVLAEAVKTALLRDGEALTVVKLQLSRSTLSKLAAGLPTRRGTQALAALKLGLVSELGANLAGELVGD
jgi:hypothetical protein